MRLSPDDVRHVAELAKLSLTAEEAQEYAGQLSDILAYADALKEIDTTGVAPTPYVLPLTSVMREDEPHDGLSNEEALANAPDAADGFFRVKAYFGE